jgi:hypothetical protein
MPHFIICIKPELEGNIYADLVLCNNLVLTTN